MLILIQRVVFAYTSLLQDSNQLLCNSSLPPSTLLTYKGKRLSLLCPSNESLLTTTGFRNSLHLIFLFQHMESSKENEHNILTIMQEGKANF
jgi:hypothetical protein